MTKVAKIVSLENSDEFITILKNSDLLIYEDIQGSKIFVKWDGGKFAIKPTSLRGEELNFIDLTVQKFYNQCFAYFHTLPDYVTDLLNNEWWFCFDYFPDNQPANINYNRVPKNNLILNCIVKGSKWTYDFDELVEYSDLFGTDVLPVIFKGRLSDKQLEVIELYLNTNKKDIEYVFGEDNFAYFFYKILNPDIKNSFLMDDENFNDNLEKMIIKIDGKTDYTFEILNPLYNKMEDTNSSEYVEIYTIILIKFLEFCQLIDINKYKPVDTDKDQLYVWYISNMFNEFIDKHGDSIKVWEFDIPSFFKEDKFKINTSFILNDKTKKYILTDSKIEYVFKCILGSFNKKRKKLIGIFNEVTIELFNQFVYKLDRKLDDVLSINKELRLGHGELKNFKDYFKLSYNTDAAGDVYPDVYDEFIDSETGGEKKKKKGIDKNTKK